MYAADFIKLNARCSKPVGKNMFPVYNILFSVNKNYYVKHQFYFPTLHSIAFLKNIYYIWRGFFINVIKY